MIAPNVQASPAGEAQGANGHGPGGPGRGRSLAAGLVRGARPKQWLKNLLVLAAPGAAGVLGHQGPLLRSVLAFVVFCLVASGTYLLNDTVDVDADRLHPVKRLRPVAAGTVGVGLARVVGLGLGAGGLGVSAVLGWKFSLVIAIYLAVQVAYTLRLKREPILDVAAVSSGFLLRAIAGGLAGHVPISEWFLIVTAFGSLFMVTGKRGAEHALMAGEGGPRSALAEYTDRYLRSLLVTASTVTITAYCLWAFESQRTSHHAIWFQLSIVPFVLAMFRYGFLLDRGIGGEPEDVVLGDRTLQVLAVAWVVVFAVGVYA